MELLKLNWEEKTSTEYFKIKKLKSSIGKLNESLPDNILFCFTDKINFKRFFKEGCFCRTIYSVTSISRCQHYNYDEIHIFNNYTDCNLSSGSYLYGVLESPIKYSFEDIRPSILYCKDNFIKKIIDNTSSNKWAKDARILSEKYGNKEL
mgnify:CR=1 FL=1